MRGEGTRAPDSQEAGYEEGSGKQTSQVHAGVRSGQPSRQPFQAAVDISMPAGFGGQNGFVTVPAKKRLVIEYVSGEAFMPTGQKCLFSVITTIGGAATGTRHYLDTDAMGTFGAPDYFRAGQVVRPIYNAHH